MVQFCTIRKLYVLIPTLSIKCRQGCSFETFTHILKEFYPLYTLSVNNRSGNCSTAESKESNLQNVVDLPPPPPHIN